MALLYDIQKYCDLGVSIILFFISSFTFLFVCLLACYLKKEMSLQGFRITV